MLSASDAKSEFTHYGYDAANQKIAMTNRAGNVWTYSYTLRGKLERTTDPLTNSTINSFDSANRLISTADPLGNTSSNSYDANGNVVASIDKIGQRWSKTYDRLNRVVSDSDPLGNTKRTTYDPAGRIKEVFTPNSYPSLHSYDGRGRLSKWVDAENFEWRYHYDGVGNITNITDALNGHYIMSYGPRNERRSEQNQDTNIWQYEYDEVLRLKRQIDPNGTIRTLSYYPRSGPLQQVQFANQLDEFTYDLNDNPETITRTVNNQRTGLVLTYDVLDRVKQVDDAFDRTIHYGFDALSRIIAVTYPDGKILRNNYDAIGRLTNQTDWANRQTTYAYDKADRLIRRGYPNGVIQHNSFDNAGRLSSLSYSPLNSQPSTNAIEIALTYAYDRNGNKTESTERGTLRWRPPLLTDEQADYTAAGRLKTRTIQPTMVGASSTSPQISGNGVEAAPTGVWSYSYDPSGNMTNASNGSETYSLTYDEDNRTTSTRYATPTTNVLIQNRYDALGRRISRTMNGTETRYVLDLSGSMERILCDTDANNQITAYYIHGPDLVYKVDPVGNVLCYHADAMANIIALTGTNSTTVAQYAYTPYGRLLGSTSVQPLAFSPQPFLFVGSQGVMEELPNLYFMRARYYSADSGAFLSTDPVKNIGPGWKPDAFQYANGNPNLYSDPDGKFFVPAFVLGAAVGMVKGFVSEVVVQTASALTGGRFDWDEVVTSTAAEGLGEGAAFATGNLAVGGAVSDSYRGYIDALSKGENYSLKQGLFDAAKGGLKSYTFDKLVPKVSLTGGNYFGSVRGPNASTLKGAFSGSHFRNGLAESVFDTSMKATSTVLGNLSLSSRTVASSSPPMMLNPVQATSQTSPTTSNPNIIRAGQTLAMQSGGGTTSTGSSTYTIRTGDTLSGIANRFGTTVSALARLNNISNPNRINAGGRLRTR